MKCSVTEITPAVYRISTFHPEYGLQFNQFLIADDDARIELPGRKPRGASRSGEDPSGNIGQTRNQLLTILPMITFDSERNC